MYPGLMLCFKYSTRIPLVRDASIMVFPLLEWCVRLWPAPLSRSLEKSEGEREKKAREAQPKQLPLCRGPPYKARKTRGSGRRTARCSVPGGAVGRHGQCGGGLQPATGYQCSVSGNSGSALELLLFFPMSWNKLFNTLGFIYPKALAAPKGILRPLVHRQFVPSTGGTCHHTCVHGMVHNLPAYKRLAGNTRLGGSVGLP